MSEPITDVIARLQDALLRPHAVSPVKARRKASDMPPPNGLTEGYGTRQNTNANRHNGGGSCYFKPRAEYYANNPVPATARATAANVKPAGGRKITDGDIEQARADSEANDYRTAVSALHNMAVATGEMPLPGLILAAPETRMVPLPEFDEARHE